MIRAPLLWQSRGRCNHLFLPLAMALSPQDEVAELHTRCNETGALLHASKVAHLAMSQCPPPPPISLTLPPSP